MEASVTGEEDEVRVVIADDHDVLREAMRDLLAESGLDVVGMAGDGGRAVELARELVPDVVLIDLRMPGVDGIEATLQIRDEDPTVQVVVLTAEDDERTLRRTEEAGAIEHLLKGTPPSQICEAVERAGAIARRGRSGRGGSASTVERS